jgi:hypothetical protein
MDNQLIRKFIRKECSPLDIIEIQHWVLNSRSKEYVTALFKAIWENESPHRRQRPGSS